MDFIFVLVLGALWGSFANVCIYRLPLEKGVVSGRSFCPKCKNLITWKDNIPIISFLFLKGKCRYCNKKISLQYVLVETISILFFLIIYILYGISITTLLLLILSLSFLIIFFIDFKHYIIPNVLTFSMMSLGFIKSFLPSLHPMFPNYINSLIGGIFGYGIIWSIIFFYKQIRKKEGMGLGDAKLFLMVGIWLGIKSIYLILASSAITGAIIGSLIIYIYKKDKDFQIPYGCFIVIASALYPYLGSVFYNWI